MRTFEKKWDQLEKKNCIVIVRHMLFGKQIYDCNMLKIINDEHRIGVIIKGRELFIKKKDIVDFWMYDNTYHVRDNMLKIAIVNKM